MLGNVKVLLAAGANPDGGPPATEAAVAGQPQVTARPLVVAAQKGLVAIVTTLLDAGAHVDLPQPDGSTAFHWALKNGHLTCAQLLVDRGANSTGLGVSLRAIDARHALTRSCLALSRHTAKLTTDSGLTAVHLAVISGKEAAVTYALGLGVDVNSHDAGKGDVRSHTHTHTHTHQRTPRESQGTQQTQKTPGEHLGRPTSSVGLPPHVRCWPAAPCPVLACHPTSGVGLPPLSRSFRLES